MPPLPTTMTLLAPGSLAHSAPMLSVSLNVSTFGLSVAKRLGRAPAQMQSLSYGSGAPAASSRVLGLGFQGCILCTAVAVHYIIFIEAEHVNTTI